MQIESRKSIHRERASITPTPIESENNRSSDDEFAESGTDNESHEKSNIKPNQEKNDTLHYSGWSGFKMCTGVSICAAFGCIIALGLLPLNGENNNESNKTCSFDKLRSKYAKQDEYTWKTLSVGIENIINERSDSPGVYLFVHKGEHSMQNLVRDIAKISSSCFDYKRSPVYMVSDDFTSQQAILDYGYAIEKYKMKIKEGNVILIVNLNAIPAQAAKALHTICDTYSPIVKNVVIFLTLIVEENKGNPVEIAENKLYDLWGAKIDSNELHPLITRVTDQVIALKA